MLPAILVVGCGEVKEDEHKVAKGGAKVLSMDMGDYDEVAATLPRYPKSYVEHSERVPPKGDFVALLRVHLQTRDPFDEVKEFYRSEFRKRYGNPTREVEKEGYYHVEKSSSPDADPFFQVDVVDLGEVRRITIVRSDRNR